MLYSSPTSSQNTKRLRSNRSPASIAVIAMYGTPLVSMSHANAYTPSIMAAPLCTMFVSSSRNAGAADTNNMEATIKKATN